MNNETQRDDALRHIYGRKMNSMSYYDAYDLLKDGYCINRKGWKTPRFLCAFKSVPLYSDVRDCFVTIEYRAGGGKSPGWQKGYSPLSEVDMKATDWQSVIPKDDGTRVLIPIPVTST